MPPAPPMTRRRFLHQTSRSALSIAAIGGALGIPRTPGQSQPASRPTGSHTVPASPSACTRPASRFYRPENPGYTIFDSAADSLRFTLSRCMTTCRGHACATSSFVDPEGTVMEWHDFGPLEGPGWAANAVGAAHEFILWARLTGRPQLEQTAVSLLDHVLENGFVDGHTGLIRGYRHIPSDRIVLNFKHDNAWFCPGSTARIAVQMLLCSDLVAARRQPLRASASGYARWIDAHLKPLPNGWFPRRCTLEGTPYLKGAEGGQDPFAEASADSLFIAHLWAELTARGLGDYRRALATMCRNFIAAGGIYASINHDTYDAQENVAYAVAFRVLRRAGQVLGDPALGAWAREHVLPGLDRFKMCEDRNGVSTTGLLYMEDSWPTAYLWENAEVALAYLEAFEDEPRESYLSDALTILRACAAHHYGPHGFLTEGVDWSNHVGREHHIDGQEFGAIRYTEPFLNNQHIVEPTHRFLVRFARVECQGETRRYYDHEDNLLVTLKGPT